MRYLIIGTLACLCAGSAVQAQTVDPQAAATITRFVDAFNKGDMAGAAATHAADVVIVDEVAPFLWRGTTALKDWAAALAADSKTEGMSDEKVTLSAAARMETKGSDAYVVVPAVFSFKKGGTAMRESAHLAVVLKKDANGWLIQSWTWTGPKAPTPAGAGTK
jgi:ketosteroid isomerase-like protein